MDRSVVISGAVSDKADHRPLPYVRPAPQSLAFPQPNTQVGLKAPIDVTAVLLQATVTIADQSVVTDVIGRSGLNACQLECL